MKISHTQRILSVIVAFTLFTGIGLPAGLHAQGQMSESCAMGMDREHEDHEMTDEQCTMQIPSGHKHSSPCNQDEVPDDRGDCELSLDCACSIDQATVRADAVQNTPKAKIILPGTVFNRAARSRSLNGLYSVPIPLEHSSPPPVFLMNSAFLN